MGSGSQRRPLSTHRGPGGARCVSHPRRPPVKWPKRSERERALPFKRGCAGFEMQSRLPRDSEAARGQGRGERRQAVLASWPGAPLSPGSPCKTERSVSRPRGTRTLQVTWPSSRWTVSLRSRLSKDNDRRSRQTRTPRAGSGRPVQGGRGRQLPAGRGAASPGPLESARTASGAAADRRAETGSLAEGQGPRAQPSARQLRTRAPPLTGAMTEWPCATS